MESKRRIKKKYRRVERGAQGSLRHWFDQILGLTYSALAVLLLFSIIQERVSRSVDPSFLRNLLGPIGRFVGVLLSGSFGWASLVLVGALAYLAYQRWKHIDGSLTWEHRLVSLLGLVGAIVASSILLAIFWGASVGGEVGVALAQPLQKAINKAGAFIVAFSFLILMLALATSLTVERIFGLALDGLTYLTKLALWRAPQKLFFGMRKALDIVADGIHFREAQPEEEAERNVAEMAEVEKPSKRSARKAKKDSLENLNEDFELGDVGKPSSERAFEDGYREESMIVVKRRVPEKLDIRSILKRPEAEVPEGDPFADYQAPDISVLIEGGPGVSVEDEAQLKTKSKIIEDKLRDFSIEGRVTEVHPGPVITLFEFKPAPGIKVGKISSLADDLAMSLKAVSVRIIAPIPGRGTVGIEVPNADRDVVRLRDVLQSTASLNAKSILSVALGKDTYGDPVVVDIASMPHLLIAGATGTGKSVCINAILLSLLYRTSPAELGLIMIDPKILELSVYEGIPHLRAPIVTVPKQAKAVLDWAAKEMERRYRMMQKFGVRNIDEYNKIVAGEINISGDVIKTPQSTASVAGTHVIQLRESEVLEPGIVDAKGPERTEPRESIVSEELQPLSKLVIIIDELADLMLTVGKEVEELITRLAQKARAAGIHLIVATQRPSVDVITGLIKANFPARLSFKVTSRVDSRTILDSMGSEKLLGRGDMLFMQPGSEGLKRVHGAFVSDGEVKRVIAAVKKNCGPQYDSHIIAVCEKALLEEANAANGSGLSVEVSEYDEFYDKAVELVMQKGYASTSMIQRAFRLGYNRAARIVEMMEKEGLVGPMDGAKPRQVLVNNEQEPM